MKIALRPYQEEMFNVSLAALKKDKFVLIQAATAAGKTIFFAKLVERLLRDYPKMRIAILAHRLELINQAKDKLLKVWPEAPIGVACASAKEKTDLDAPVTIGSIQTLANHVNNTAPFHLIIIDEVHRLPPQTTDSQYKKWLDTMMQYNNSVRVLGLTATPFRLGHGYIYGDRCKATSVNWFESLHYSVGIKALQQQGFLCGYRAKAVVDIGKDLDSVKSTGGEFNLGELSELMSKLIHIESAVKAYQQYGEERKHVVVFAVTIEHAETLKAAFQKEGYTSAIVHSKMPNQQRQMMLKLFESGQTQFIFSVGILTEGWDSAAIDCVLLCRPTKSPALYVQMVGRGLRLHEDKEDVLILDLANNCLTHGDPAEPTISIPQEKEKKAAPQKHCPKCKEICHASATECPGCGYIWEVEEKEEFKGNLKMKPVTFKKPEKPKPFTFEISNFGLEEYTSKSGNRMCKLWMMDAGFIPPKYINEFWQFDLDAHEYARKKARIAWHTIAGTKPPESTIEAVQRGGELAMAIPRYIEVIKDGNWLKVHKWQAPPPQSSDRGYVPESVMNKKVVEQEVYEDCIPF